MAGSPAFVDHPGNDSARDEWRVRHGDHQGARRVSGLLKSASKDDGRNRVAWPSEPLFGAGDSAIDFRLKHYRAGCSREIGNGNAERHRCADRVRDIDFKLTHSIVRPLTAPALPCCSFRDFRVLP